jgi:hypothetical protein
MIVLIQIAGLVLGLLLLVPGHGSAARASGARGAVVVAGSCGSGTLARSPLDVQIKVRNRNGRALRTIRSGSDGKFRVRLRPGRYTLEPGKGSSFALPPKRVRVTVKRRRVARVTITYRRVCPTPPGVPKPGTPGAVLQPATSLRSSVECSQTQPRQGVAHLSWVPAGGSAAEQRVAVSIYRDGFETGKFDSSESLAPERAALDWRQLSGQAIHLWRVLTRYGDTWVASETASFEGPLCVADNANP